jgi:hypothetical protein
LTKIRLSKKEYGELKKRNNDARVKDGLSVINIGNADLVVKQAMQYIVSSDPNRLWPALAILTGLRPVEIFRTAKFTTTLNNKQSHPGFWACQTRFAKRGTMKVEDMGCRDRPFLVPYFLIERAMRICRKRWPYIVTQKDGTVKALDNRKLSAKYSSNWATLLQKAFQMIPGITPKLCRRFFAVYSYEYFGKSVFISGETQSSLNMYASWVLGHVTLGDQVIAYSSLIIRPRPKLKVFELGINLRVVEEAPRRRQHGHESSRKRVKVER